MIASVFVEGNVLSVPRMPWEEEKCEGTEREKGKLREGWTEKKEGKAF